MAIFMTFNSMSAKTCLNQNEMRFKLSRCNANCQKDIYLRQITGPCAKHEENTETTSLEFLKGAGWR